MEQPIIRGSKVCPGCGKPYSSVSNIKKYNTYHDETTGLTWHELCYKLKDCTYRQLMVGADDDFSEDDWRLAVFEYLYSKICLPSPDWDKICEQMHRYLADGHKYKAIYYCLVYIYLVKKNDPAKAQGGIGLCNYYWDESSTYWNDYFRQTAEKKKQIDELMKHNAELLERKRTTRKRTEKPKLDIAAEFKAFMEGAT